MYGAAITIDDKATPALRAALRTVAPGRLNPVIGRAAVNTVRSHLFTLDRNRRNKLGGRRSHFYAKAARSTNYRIVNDNIIVSINHVGIAQRYFGGSIYPVRRKRLAIPATPAAYGKSPREFDDLEPVFGRRGLYGLARRPQTQLRRTRKGFKPGRTVKKREKLIYFLVKSVTQSPDKTVLPAETDISLAIEKAAKLLIAGPQKGPRK